MVKNKKALSTIIATVILILLTIAATIIIWTTIQGTIEDNISSGEACNAEIFDKITINSRYTCYNETSGLFQFSISLGEIEIDSLLISIGTEGFSNSFEMSNEELAIPYITNYTGGLGNINLPAKNSGKTYYFNITASELSGEPVSIIIAPIIDGISCQKTDSLFQIDSCEALI